MSLADAMLNGMANRETCRRLDELLLADLSHRQWYLEYIDIRSSLMEHAERLTEEECVQQLFTQIDRRQRHKHLPWRLIGSAAATLTLIAACITVAIFWWTLPNRPVGRLVVTSPDTTWAKSIMEPGDLIREGQRLELTNGTATIELDSGATFDAIAPAMVTVGHENKVTLWNGTLTAYVPNQARGFIVRTHDAEVVDLGTEFLVERTNGQDTHVFVKQGRVEARLLDQSGQPFSALDLTTGRSARLNLAEGFIKEIDTIASWRKTMDDVDRFHGGIQRLQGSMRSALSAPAVLDEGAHPTRGHLLLIPEQSSVLIKKPLSIQTRMGLVTIPPGTLVDSYLIHCNPTDKDRGAKGAATFQQQVLAIIDGSEELALTDSIFGLSTMKVPAGDKRGFEAEDNIVMYDDHRTVKLHPGISGANFLDQCRILVRHSD
ncbi:FecR protein [Calycomorphotria hydatis]|uniref:FecR protein n=2 Tax=Calycomorphotria hydatis TaxID=2528027 RepID=A0A517TAL7_9PLAN|nr:FecR protein [Calycomorphotria hydatis]